jgi:predicted nucleic acid-binding protein
MMLVDTDVLIWHLRGYPQATRRLDQMDKLTLSAVTYLEVLQGLRNKVEFAAIKKMLECRNAILLPVTESITQRATMLMESLTLSHGLQMGDALIAATALDHQLPLLTGNVKHFACIEHLLIEGFAI